MEPSERETWQELWEGKGVGGGGRLLHAHKIIHKQGCSEVLQKQGRQGSLACIWLGFLVYSADLCGMSIGVRGRRNWQC